VEARNTWHERGLAKPRCGENEWGDGWDSNPQRLESQSSEETTHNAWDDPKSRRSIALRRRRAQGKRVFESRKYAAAPCWKRGNHEKARHHSIKDGEGNGKQSVHGGLTNQGNRRPPGRAAPPVAVRVDRVVRPHFVPHVV